MNSVGTFAAHGTQAQNLAWTYTAGLGAAVVNVPAGAFVTRISCDCEAAGATVQIGGGAAISLPPGGIFDENLDGGVRGPITLTFVGTRAYYVSWVA